MADDCALTRVKENTAIGRMGQEARSRWCTVASAFACSASPIDLVKMRLTISQPCEISDLRAFQRDTAHGNRTVTAPDPSRQPRDLNVFAARGRDMLSYM